MRWLAKATTSRLKRGKSRKYSKIEPFDLSEHSLSFESAPNEKINKSTSSPVHPVKNHALPIIFEEDMEEAQQELKK